MKTFFVSLLSVILIFNKQDLFAQFNLKSLNNFTVNNATSLKFGPDERLYVSEVFGNIKALTIEREPDGTYTVISEEAIGLIKNIVNHNDNGSSSTTTANRQITGIYLEGTTAAPVIYVSSSDPRWGGPSGDKNLDTNSGVISRLTWKHTQPPGETDFSLYTDGQLWDKVDLVRGLPRSEENHSVNALNKTSINGKNYLLVCVGGFTNAGSPSKNFAKITEYACLQP